MNYNDYINETKPSLELRERIHSNVKKEIAKKQINRTKTIKGTLSMVACLVILMATGSVINSFTKNANDDTLTKISENDNEKFIIITEENGSKLLPQEILINNAYYRQFSSYEVKSHLKKDNGNFVIKKSDIGEYICKINSNNIYNVDNQEIEDDEKAKQNEFYNAKVYKYSPCNDLSNIIVETADNIYLFHLVNLDESVSIKELYNLFSIDKANQVEVIEIWQDEIIDENITGFGRETITGTTVKEVMTKSIMDKDEINAVMQNLLLADSVKNEDDNDIYYDIHRNKINENMSETGQYRLIFKLSNGLSFEFWICKDSKYIQVLESTYFELNADGINKIIEIIEK